MTKAKSLVLISAVILALELTFGLVVFVNQFKLFEPNLAKDEIMIFLGFGILLTASLVITTLVLGLSILYLKLRHELTKEASK